MIRPPPQFHTLDALRGVAAIGVMLFHAPAFGHAAMPGGYLAVDLFFMMSGFVIAATYAPRMAAGMGAREFLWRRAVRLWPMLALGAVLGMALHGGHAGSLLLLPDWRSAANLYPANPPLWSLLFEWLAYAAFAVGLWRAGPRLLGVITLCSAAVLSWLVLAGEPLVDFGAHWHTLAGGLARIGFGFGGGMLAWHWWNHRAAAPPRASWLALLPLAAMAVAMATVPTGGGPLALLALFALCPAILWAALAWNMPTTRLARLLGDLSYPLYCIHVPLLAASGAAETAVALALPLAAWALHRWVDVPARGWLGRWITARTIKPASA